MSSKIIIYIFVYFLIITFVNNNQAFRSPSIDSMKSLASFSKELVLSQAKIRSNLPFKKIIYLIILSFVIFSILKPLY